MRLAFNVVSFWGPILTGATMAMIGAVTVARPAQAAAIPRWLTVVGAIAFLEQAMRDDHGVRQAASRRRGAR